MIRFLCRAMILPLFCLVLLLPVSSSAGTPAAGMPDDFVHVSDLIPDAVLEIRYTGSDNFLGQPVDGYLAPVCILHRDAAAALKQVQAALAPFGLGIKLFDGFRPQQAVDHFVRWAKDLSDTRMKSRYYPDVDKANLFAEGYIAARSGHSRGSTVDLTLVSKTDGTELDMGSGFDFFGPVSWPTSQAVTAQQRANRMLLQAVMVTHGFKPYMQEWWHFTLADEAYPDTYFDFPVE